MEKNSEREARVEMIAKHFAFGHGVGRSDKHLPSFDKALIDAGVGNYNLVRLSSILPAHCELADIRDLPDYLEEGSLLPTAYSTISSNVAGQRITSTIGVGYPKDREKVGVIMEYSVCGVPEAIAVATLISMIKEAFEVRGWELGAIDHVEETAIVSAGETCTTFACISEW